MKNIKVNGEELQTSSEVLTYEELVTMAGLKAEYNPTVVFHCKLEKKHHQVNGTLLPGQEVEVLPGMTFSIAYTGNA